MPESKQHTLTLFHSPDSDDMVMWWPLTGMTRPDGTHIQGPLGKPAIDTGRFAFQCIARDIESLNQATLANEPGLDITAISAHTYPHIKDRYRITRSGGSFGEGYGPRVVVRTDDGRFAANDLSELTRRLGPGAGSDDRLGKPAKIAVPGKNTTAFLVLSLMLGEFQYMVLPFMQVMDAVRDNTADAGLLIHEAQLSYESMGLRMVQDLGQWWQQTHSMPLPLGLNVLQRDLDDRLGPGTCEEISKLLAASIRHAVDHAADSRSFLLMHAEDRPEWKDDALLKKYLAMYVSDLTLDMGGQGIKALSVLLKEGALAGLCPDPGVIDVV